MNRHGFNWIEIITVTIIFVLVEFAYVPGNFISRNTTTFAAGDTSKTHMKKMKGMKHDKTPMKSDTTGMHKKMKKKTPTSYNGTSAQDLNFATVLTGNLNRKVKLTTEQKEKVEQLLLGYKSEVMDAVLNSNNYAGSIISDQERIQYVASNLDQKQNGNSGNISDLYGKDKKVYIPPVATGLTGDEENHLPGYMDNREKKNND